MGQSPSSPSPSSSPTESTHSTRSTRSTRSTNPTHSTRVTHHRSLSTKSEINEIINISNDNISYIDYTSEIPDDCLSLVFEFLNSGDRKRCSVVSKRWLVVEGQSRHRLALKAQSEIFSIIPKLFSRFDHVTKLSLRCDRRSVSVNDDGLVLISSRCKRLTRLKLRGCREVTEVGMKALGENCKELRKFSCGSCMFGAKGMNALLGSCASLEELSVKRLRGITDGGGGVEMIGGGAVAVELKSIHLKELYNGQMFGPLISGAKKLKTLKLLRCLGDWDKVLETVAGLGSGLKEVHLERLQVSDVGLSALSNCLDLEILHIVKTPDCTDSGVIEVAGKCRYLRKLHIDGWKTNRIGHDGLVAIAKHSLNLQELVLIGINPSSISLEAIAKNCQKLERLALCGSETISDTDVSCIASKCMALKKLCIKGCPVSDEGIEAFAWGCPNLIKIKVKKCKNVTGDVGDWLRARRGSLVVNLDVEIENVDASTSESGALEDPVEFNNQVVAVQPEPLATSSSGRGSVFKTRFGLFGGRGLVGCTFSRWSVGNSSTNGSL